MVCRPQIYKEQSASAGVVPLGHQKPALPVSSQKRVNRAVQASQRQGRDFAREFRIADPMRCEPRRTSHDVRHLCRVSRHCKDKTQDTRHEAQPQNRAAHLAPPQQQPCRALPYSESTPWFGGCGQNHNDFKGLIKSLHYIY